MDDNLEFKSLKELYERSQPALYSKVKEMKRLGYKYVNEIDIWNYLVEHSWKKKVNLELYELINDILYADNYSISEYALNNANKLKEEQTVVNDGELF